jgi:hypothetical protein
MTTRTPERLEALGYILSDGLSYSWFQVEELDDEAVTATVWTGDDDSDEEDEFTVKHEITADDVARGLRMVREYFNGERELYNGQWDHYRAEDPDWTPTKGSTDSYLHQLIVFDRTDGADGDYDADTADMVMQYAILGEVRYG